MMKRRVFIALALATSLAACTEPLLDQGVAQQLSVQSVNLDVSAIDGVKGRNITVSKGQIQADVAATLNRELRAASVQGTRAVSVNVKLTSFSLVSPGQAVLLGGVSTIRGILDVRDIGTGEVILAPTDVFGFAKGGYAPGGLIALAVSKTPQKDYEATVAGFAANVRKRLFEG